MINHERSIVLEYFVLTMIFFVGLFSLLFFKNFKNMQIFSILIMSFAYILWGMAHHSHEKTLHYKIVVEYILLSAAVSALLIILLNLAQ